MFKKENLRKNFLRVKQNIDQNLGRSEKSEVLSEDQQENEKRVEVVKHAFQNVSKRAAAILQAQGSDFDKRLKKLPETNLGVALHESAAGLSMDSLLGQVCQHVGNCQGNLAQERVQFETALEQDFIKPINHIVEVDIPSIVKLRKTLNKSILDMDSAKNRLQQAVRQSTVAGVNMSNAANKVDIIKDESDEATAKVENNKDYLSIELCQFTAKESEHAYILLGLLEAQASYHRQAMETIEAFIPGLRETIQNSPAKPCYGIPLEEHLRLTGRDIAVVLEACVLTLMEIGLEEEGLFRVAGSASKVKKLKASFDAFPFDGNALDVMVQEYWYDPFTVAGALKQYLRELPEPLLTFALHDDFMHAISLPQDQRLQALWTVINSLPLPNYNNFRYLIKFLSKLKDKSDLNKMKASNIAIVVGPNLLWCEGQDSPSMVTTSSLSTMVEAVVTHADYFFPGEYEFNVSGYEAEEHLHDRMAQQHPDTPSIQVPAYNPQHQSPASPKSTSPASLSVNISSDGSTTSGDPTSPVQRRVSRKPAPPPPERPSFNVKVTATTGPTTPMYTRLSSDGNTSTTSSGSSSGGSNIGTSAEDSNSNLQQHSLHSQNSWPRSAPLASPESPTELPNSSDKHRTSGSHLERPNMPPPDRPKLPPTVTIPPPTMVKGHQRSASTGAMMATTNNSNNSTSTPTSAGSGSIENGSGGLLLSGAAAISTTRSDLNLSSATDDHDLSPEVGESEIEATIRL